MPKPYGFTSKAKIAGLLKASERFLSVNEIAELVQVSKSYIRSVLADFKINNNLETMEYGKTVLYRWKRGCNHDSST